MSIRKRIIISNALVFLVPLIFGAIALSFMVRVFNDKFGPEDHYMQLGQLRTVFLENNSNKIDIVFKDLESKGYYIRLGEDDGIIHQTKGYEEMYERIVGDIECLGNTTEYTLSNEYGAAFFFSLNIGQNNKTLSVITDKQNHLAAYNQAFIDGGFHYIQIMMQVAFLSIISVVVITITILTYFITRSILKPLKLLKEGTRQIKSGNLHHSIVYPKKDEFGDVCADFEDMRISLLTLKEEERRYEENRKELIAGITHDLNTPLTSIKGFVSGLLEGIINTPEKQMSYLKSINQTADQMRKLIDELLLYSTLDMNGVPFSFEKIDLVEYFKDCLQEIGPAFQQKEMCLNFNASCKNAYANIDYTQFNRIVLNILENSVKYKKNECGNISITVSKGINEIYISFKDDGTGIPENESRDIFQVFYRSDKSRNKPGNGLGLAIVQRIVLAHNGSIYVNPDYIDGLEVIIVLPQKEDEEGENFEANPNHRR